MHEKIISTIFELKSSLTITKDIEIFGPIWVFVLAGYQGEIQLKSFYHHPTEHRDEEELEKSCNDNTQDLQERKQ